MAVKDRLESLEKENTILDWELPHGNILTRLSAAVFFLTVPLGHDVKEICHTLPFSDKISIRLNEEKKLSKLDWRLEFPGEAV